MSFGQLEIATPLGGVIFPVVPGVAARGAAIVSPAGVVRIHIIVAPFEREPQRHLVYSVRRDPNDWEEPRRKSLEIKLLREIPPPGLFG